MEGYVAAKKLIMRPKGAASIGIIGVDDEPCRKLFAALKAEGKRRMIPISAERAVEGGVSAVNGKLVDAISGKPIEILDLKSRRAPAGQAQLAERHGLLRGRAGARSRHR